MLGKLSLLLFLVCFSVLPIPISAECTWDTDAGEGNNKTEALKYKLVAVATILVAGAIGVSLPILGKVVPAFSPDNNFFFLIKAFAAGVILATGMVHILPDAFESLTSPCLGENPSGSFPFSGFVAMLTAIGTLMVDTFTTNYYKRSHFLESKGVNGDEEKEGEHAGHVHPHSHVSHGHSHGSSHGFAEDFAPSDLIKHKMHFKFFFQSSYSVSFPSS